MARSAAEPRRRGPAFGLRSRLLIAFVATSALTLVAAALALLGPLQERLQDESARSLSAAARSDREALNTAIKKDAYTPTAFGNTAAQIHALAQRTGARIALFSQGGTPIDGVGDDLGEAGIYDATGIVLAGRAQGDTRNGVTSYGFPLDLNLAKCQRYRCSHYYVLVLRKSDSNTAGAASEVRRAFAAAAGAGLAVSLVLALALSTGLSRRLGRLRNSARRIAAEGTDAPPPGDRGRDDIGELARTMTLMQDALRRQEAARRRFVATASHELRTPLTSLQGTFELLGEDLARSDFDREEAAELVGAAREQITRLANLATELLDLSRLDAGLELRSEPVELGELTRAVAAEFGVRADEQGTAIEVLESIGPCWARADPGAVARIVRILVDNALRFAPAGEPVRVSCAYAGEKATLAVHDRGPGVPEHDRDRIFERFQRGSATGGEGGFGLGLAIGRELSVRLGGGLEIDAGATGGRFVLSLPIQPQRDLDTPADEAPADLIA